jgi:hypothetical protein
MHAHPHQEGNDMEIMFEELDNYFEEEHQGRNQEENNNNNNNNNNEGQQHEKLIFAELPLYKQEPSIRLSNEDGSGFNCPLTG